MAAKREVREVWLLHEKIGKQRWKMAKWFTPICHETGKDLAQRTARVMTDHQHSYKAVRYVPAKRGR